MKRNSGSRGIAPASSRSRNHQFGLMASETGVLTVFPLLGITFLEHELAESARHLTHLVSL